MHVRQLTQAPDMPCTHGSGSSLPTLYSTLLRLSPYSSLWFTLPTEETRMSRDDWFLLLLCGLAGGPIGIGIAMFFIYYTRDGRETQYQAVLPYHPLVHQPQRVQIRFTTIRDRRDFDVYIGTEEYELSNLENDILNVCWNAPGTHTEIIRALNRTDGHHICQTLETLVRLGLLIYGSDRRHYINPHATLVEH